jgi:peptidoglycan/LPS O-acetylase OafA/YrhL
MIVHTRIKTLANDSLVIHFLRGLAAFMVVIFHARVDLWQGWQVVSQRQDLGGLVNAMSYISIPTVFGGSGVMLFFILSGYCIALPHAGPNGRALRFGEYFARRFFRIYPPYLAAIALCGLIAIWARACELTSLADTQSYFTSIFMVQNYSTGQILLNPSLWSLPVEMELYLIFPLFYLGLRRLGSKMMWIAAGLVSAAGLALHELGWSAAALNFAKFWLIWWSGAMLAEWKQTERLGKPSLWIMLLAVFSFGLAASGTIKKWDDAWLHFLYAYGFFVLLWLMLAYEETIDPILRKAAPLVIGAGTISYSLYLVHFPLLRVFGVLWVNHFGAKPLNFIWPILSILPITLFAWGFYRIIEKPSHQWAKRWSRKAAS